MDRNGNAKRYKAVIDVVALRKESVDRNISGFSSCFPSLCRSPQGERG